MTAVDDSPVVRLAADLAAELAADAARLEREGVDRALLERMAAIGLLAVSGPPVLGGAWPAEQRRVAELLAGASPDAWFVWFQHGPVVRMLKASENSALVARRLPDLCAGRLLGGVAWSTLRTPAPTVRAVRNGAGWSLTGFQPWCTGWGLIDVVLVGALVEADRRGGVRHRPRRRPRWAAQRRRPAAGRHGRHVHARPAARRLAAGRRGRRPADRPRAVGAGRPGAELQPAALDPRRGAGGPRPARAPCARSGRRAAGAGARRPRAGVRPARRGRRGRAARGAPRAARDGAAAGRRVLHGAAHGSRRPGHGPRRARAAAAARGRVPGRAQPGGARPSGDAVGADRA